MEPTTASTPTAPEIAFEPASGPESHAAEVTSWLLEGRFFTVDADGAITMWSPPAEEAFGWSRRDIVRSSFLALLAPGDRDALAEELGALLAGSPEAVAFGAEAGALDADGAHMRVALAAVPIHVGVGYEFNALLQEIASSSQTERSLEQLKARGDSVLALIEDAVAGRHAELAESEDAQRLAGALVVFRVLERSAPPVADADGDDAAQTELVEALRAAEDSRARAHAEAERLRAELADASQRAVIDGDRSREELARAHQEARADSQRLEAELHEVRERLGAEVERLLGELRGSRERADAAVERVTAELASAEGESDLAAKQLSESRRELSEARAEIERQAAELEAAAARDGALRAELRALSEEAAEARALAERAAAELDQARSRPPEVVEVAPRSNGDADAASERLAAELAQARERAQQSERELAEARRHGARHAAEIDAANARAEALQGELATLAEQAAQSRADAERTRGELERSEAELADARAAREAEASSARAEASLAAEKLTAELDAARAQLASARDDADRAAAASAEQIMGLRADLDRAQAELATAREVAERAAAEARERIVGLSADVERLTTELASTRSTPRASAERAAAPPKQEVAAPVLSANQRSSDYAAFFPDAEPVVEEVAPPKPREPIAVETLLQMSREIDAKNRYTQRHSERVAGYAAALAEGLGFERPRIEAIRQAALLHDVGKSEVPQAILAKDEPLNLEELDELARHSQVGHELLVAASEPEIAEWVRHIHERFDGGGFPLGLTGTDIPEESRVLHAADALDHMTRPRAYRRNRPLREALSELAFCAGTRLDPEIARTVIDLVERGKIKVEGPAAPQRLGPPLGRRL